MCKCLPAFVLFQRVEYFVVYKLIWVVAIVGEDVYSTPLKVLQNSRGTGCRAALSVVALAYDLASCVQGIVNKFRKLVGVAEIAFIAVSVIRKDLDIYIRHPYAEKPLANCLPSG